MSRRVLPGLGLTGGYDAGDNAWHDEMNNNLLTVSVTSQLVVESMSTPLPGSPTNGMIYIVPTAGATQWKIAVRENGAWVYLTPGIGWTAWVKSPGKAVRWDGSAWADDAAGGTVAVRDEGTTALAAASALNFAGAGVTVSDAGSGVATVTIPGGGGGGGSSLEAAFTPPPAASTWTQQNFHASNTHLVDFTSPVAGVRLYEDVFAYGNVNAVRYALKPIPGTRWQATARIRRHTRMPQFGAFGLVVRDSANGRSKVLGFDNEAAGVGALNMFSDTSYQGFEGFGGNQLLWKTDIWLRLKYDGTDCSMWHSFDGVYWTRTMVRTGTSLWPNGAGTFALSNAATHVGFGYNTNNNGATDIGNEIDVLSWSLVALP